MNVMLSEGQRELLRTKGTMLGRMLIGLLFLWSGIGIIIAGPANTALFYDSVGVPFPSLIVWPVLALKLAAGCALIAGYRAGIAAGSLIIFTLLATLFAHMSTEDINLFKNLSIVGGLLYVMAYGAGEGWKYQGTDPLAKVLNPSQQPTQPSSVVAQTTTPPQQ